MVAGPNSPVLIQRLLPVLYVVSSLLILAAVGYLARGWIRGPAVSWASTQIYGPKIDQIFAQDIEPINAKLRLLGVNPTVSNQTNGNKADCSDGNFHYLRETVICGKWVRAFPRPLPTDFRNRWPGKTDQIATILDKQGWKLNTEKDTQIPDFNYVDSLGELLSEKPPVVIADYVKQVEGIACRISLRYDTAFDSAPPTFRVDEYCVKSIDFFGGYD